MNLKKIPFKKATAETSWEIVVLTSSIALNVIYICYIYLFIYIYIYIYKQRLFEADWHENEFVQTQVKPIKLSYVTFLPYMIVSFQRKR